MVGLGGLLGCSNILWYIMIILCYGGLLGVIMSAKPKKGCRICRSEFTKRVTSLRDHTCDILRSKIGPVPASFAQQDPTGTWGTVPWHQIPWDCLLDHNGMVDLGIVFTTALPPKDTMTFRDEGEISYALGKQGGTRQFCGVFHSQF